MYRQYGEESRLARNRKNAIKDIIYRYDDIYDKLQSSKTSKDPLTEIQNRNDVGNLNFAAGSIEKAYEYWSDSLATIFKTVQPIEHYHDILQQYKPCMASKVGEKEIVLALSLLFKISCFCCYKRLEMQRLCARFACHLAYSLFESG